LYLLGNEEIRKRRRTEEKNVAQTFRFVNKDKGRRIINDGKRRTDEKNVAQTFRFVNKDKG